MFRSSAIKLLCIVIIAIIKNCRSSEANLKFPEGFLIGTASSALQVEGAWNVGGKSESFWDYFIHNNPTKIADQSTADVSIDEYHRFKEDIQLLKTIGVNHYRFSISWSRILPTGYPNVVNKEGVQYYHKVLDELEKHGIIPFVTIYHWDHPQNLEKIGGWLNEEMAYIYSEYARVIFKEFGHRIKYFATVNEPTIVCVNGYKRTTFAPSVNVSGYGEYLCVNNMLKGHALAYHIYNDEFRSKQKGQIGIVLHCKGFFSKTNDTITIDTAFDFECGWQANPIFSTEGDYPKVMKDKMASVSKLRGYQSSRLPILSKEWIQRIKGSSDFFGLNHYTSMLVSQLSDGEQVSEFDYDGIKYEYDPSWETAQSTWLKIVPDGLGYLLRTIKKKYNNPPVYITENGVSDGNGTADVMRINYLYSYMKSALTAMKDDKCNVKAYTIWSMTDSYEWNYGYKDRFGLIQIDFKSKNLTRTFKNSVSWLQKVLKTRELVCPN